MAGPTTHCRTTEALRGPAIPSLVLMVLGLASLVHGQWVEDTILLPDSLGGVVYPHCMAYDSARDRIYVGGLYGRSVVALDAVTMKRVARYPTGDAVVALCVAPSASRLYCAVNGIAEPDTVVVVVDTEADSVVKRLRVGKAPSAFSYSPTSGKVYCACGTYWFGGQVRRVDSVVVAIDVVTDSIVSWVRVGEGPSWLCYNPPGNKVYCGSLTESWLRVIDCQSDSASRIRFTRDSRAAWYFDQRDVMYVFGRGAGVYVFDCAGDSVIRTFNMHSHLQSLAFSEATGRLFCWCEYITGDRLYVVDVWHDTIIDEFVCQSDSAAVIHTPVGDKVYAPGMGTDLIVVDCSTLTVIDTVHEVGWERDAMVRTPDGKHIFCADRNMCDVCQIVATDDTVVGRTPVGVDVSALCYNPGDNKLYAAGYSSPYVCILDAGSGQVLATVLVGDFEWLTSACYNPVVNKVYCSTGNVVSVIDGTTNQVLSEIEVGDMPYDLLCVPGENKVFAACYDGLLCAIDCTRDSVEASMIVGSGNGVLCYNDSSNWVYCALYVDNRVLVLDAHTSQVVGVLQSINSPSDICYNPTSNEVYVSSYLGGMGVTVIAGDTCRVTHWVFIEQPTDLTTNPYHNVVYAVGLGGRGQIGVIDCETHRVVKLYEDLRSDGPLYAHPVNHRVYWPVCYTDTTYVMNGTCDTVLHAFPGADCWGEAYAWNPRDQRVYMAGGELSRVFVVKDTVASAVVETSTQEVMGGHSQPTFVRGTLVVPSPQVPRPGGPIALHDAAGRLVMTLQPGVNDLGRLSAGVYFIRAGRPAMTLKITVAE